MTVTTAKRKQRRPVLMRVEKLVRPETGEIIGALVPAGAVAQRELRERALHNGDEVRCEVKKNRNPKFWRLTHALGGLLADQAEGYEGRTQHAALKKLQADSATECESETFALGELGTVQRSVPRSLGFEDMDETRFQAAWKQMVRYASEHCLCGMDVDAIEQFCELTAEANA